MTVSIISLCHLVFQVNQVFQVSLYLHLHPSSKEFRVVCTDLAPQKQIGEIGQTVENNFKVTHSSILLEGAVQTAVKKP